ncbi:hypothetical protein ES703_34155 [subsurface metagenome]
MGHVELSQHGQTSCGFCWRCHPKIGLPGKRAHQTDSATFNIQYRSVPYTVQRTLGDTAGSGLPEVALKRPTSSAKSAKITGFLTD